MTNLTNTSTSLSKSRSIIEHYIIIWLDSDINHADTNTNNSFNNIRHMVHSIKKFINIDECTTFLNNIKKGQIFLIIADSFVQQHLRLINLIEQTIQINSVYIFCNDPLQEKHWKNECRKLKGIFTQIEPICNSLEQIICPPEINLPTTIISSTENINFDDLDQSYIYSKLLTNILFKIEYDDKAKQDSFDFCREYFADNNIILKQIDEFERDYNQHSPIWWYTKETTPIRTLLTDVLIIQNVDMMIKMGYFIKDLHLEIKKLYLATYQTNEKFIVYRGQGMLNSEFEKFIQRKSGLYAFDNFISTSTDEEVGLYFAKCAAVDVQCTGILFHLEIDPTICSVPYASLDNTSYYQAAEKEILFSTHTIFRIGDINRIEDGLWKVNLTLTHNADEKILSLTYHIGYDIRGATNWHSLAILLFKMGKYNKAIEIFSKIIERANGNSKEERITMVTSTYNNYGLMYDSMGEYTQALEYYEKAEMEIQEESLPSDHPSLATVYNNMGMVFLSMGDYTQALSYCEKTLEIRLKSSSNHQSLVTIYSNIGKIYESNGDYVNALSNYERAYEIQQSFLPFDHPSFTLSYNNLGGIYSLMGNYSKASSCYQQTFKIQEKSLPLDHPCIANTYNNIGYVYQLMGNYNRSLVYYKHALRIQQKNTTSNQLSLANTYNNIGLVYRFMGDYPMACSYYEKTLKIEEEYLIPEHPSLACTYNNLGAVQQLIGEYSNAFISYKKALEIWQKHLPANHPSLATVYNNIGSVHDLVKDYKEALSYYQKTVDIQQNSPSSNQLDLASTYNNMGEVYRGMGDYTTALSYYQKTLEIERKSLTTNHPSLAITLSNMAVAYDANNQYEEAFEHMAQAFDICCNALEPNHPQTQEITKYLNQLREKLPPET